MITILYINRLIMGQGIKHRVCNWSLPVISSSLPVINL
jgi:hypothetical protein